MPFDGQTQLDRVAARYRTMRGYKRQASILNVSRLLGWVLAKGPDYDMTELVEGRAQVLGEPGQPSPNFERSPNSPLALSNTASNISRVSFPVLVFWRLG